jgi:hypothetical protein
MKRCEEEKTMFKISISTDDGRVLQISRMNYLYYKDACGMEYYWDWEGLGSNAHALDPIFRRSESLLDQVTRLFLPGPNQPEE